MQSETAVAEANMRPTLLDIIMIGSFFRRSDSILGIPIRGWRQRYFDSSLGNPHFRTPYRKAAPEQ
jgi:hypothetical protein